MRVHSAPRDSPQPRPSAVVRIRSAIYQVMREMLIVSAMGTTVAAGIGSLYGWGTPFSNSSAKRDVAGFTIWVVGYATLLGILSLCPLIAFILRGQAINKHRPHEQNEHSTLTVWQSTWLTIRLSWMTITISTATAVAVTTLLLLLKVPLTSFNGHSMICTLAVIAAVPRVIVNSVRYRRRNTRNRRSIISSVADMTKLRGTMVNVLTNSAPILHRLPSWRKTMQVTGSMGVPTAAAALLAIQYIMLARKLNFVSRTVFVMFTVTSASLKALIPALVKFVIARRHVRNVRNTLFMLAGPIFHIEIQIRMAQQRATQQSIPMYLSSTLVHFMELVTRAASVAVDLAIIRLARHRKDAKVRALLSNPPSCQSRDGPVSHHILSDRVASVEEQFEKWRQGHLRVSAAEVLVEVAAEYCSIGLVSVFIVILHRNASIDLPMPSTMTMVDVIKSNCVAWATQITFEVATDVAALAVELRMGLPLVETLERDRGKFLRWMIPVVAAHASGLCLASLIVYDAAP